MNKILVLLVSVLLISFGTQSVQARETFTVGMECNYAPYNWTQSSQNETAVEIEVGQFCEGYDVQLAKLLGKDLSCLLKQDKLMLSLQE